MVCIDTLVGGFNLSVEYKRRSAKSFFRNCWTKLTSKLLALGLLTDINCGNVDNLQNNLDVFTIQLLIGGLWAVKLFEEKYQN